MRLWSLHPKYLDKAGLIGLWRETLLAKKVLEGNTKGYKNHPQLNRFKDSGDTLYYINEYLRTIYKEACKRNYCFDNSKLNIIIDSLPYLPISVTKGQIEYEKRHLLNKLKQRDPQRYNLLLKDNYIQINSTFQLINGPIAEWEKV